MRGIIVKAHLCEAFDTINYREVFLRMTVDLLSYQSDQPHVMLHATYQQRPALAPEERHYDKDSYIITN